MVDHWPVSTILDESEQKLIKEHREGKTMYLSDAEKEMVTALRREQEIIVNEQNEQSPNMKAVEEMERLREYVKENYNGLKSLDYKDVVDAACELIRRNNEKLDIISSRMGYRFDLYQNAAAETAIYPGKGTPLGLIYCALKLSGEAGEVAENVGKAIRDDGLIGVLDKDGTNLFADDLTESRRNKLKLELGDVLWYVSQAAKELGFTLEEIAQANLEKLGNRAKNGTLKGSGDDR